MAELGLSDPLWVQYLAWVKDIVAAIWAIRSSAPKASPT